MLLFIVVYKQLNEIYDIASVKMQLYITNTKKKQPLNRSKTLVYITVTLGVEW